MAKQRERETDSFKPVDLRRIKTYSIKKRKNLSNINLFAKPVLPADGIPAFFESLPEILAASNLRKEIEVPPLALYNSRPAASVIRERVIKCGLSPLII